MANSRDDLSTSKVVGDITYLIFLYLSNVDAGNGLFTLESLLYWFPFSCSCKKENPSEREVLPGWIFINKLLTVVDVVAEGHGAVGRGGIVVFKPSANVELKNTTINFIPFI